MEIMPTPVVEIHSHLLASKNVRLLIKREDMNHPIISGNKARKLKYNLEKARAAGYDTLLTFGGAYSNHIYATAAAGAAYGFKTIGMIRGEEILPLNATLQFAKKHGMDLHYLDRSSYRSKTDVDVIAGLYNKFGEFYLIPEGGTNKEAILGCAEIIQELSDEYDYYCCAVGTGGTIAGIIAGLKGKGKVVGFSSLKGDFLTEDVSSLLRDHNFKEEENWEISGEYHFGGYAKFPYELHHFLLRFESVHNIKLDPIYTAKALYGLFDMIKSDSIPSGSKILFVHTGGLQGRIGFGLS